MLDSLGNRASKCQGDYRTMKKYFVCKKARLSVATRQLVGDGWETLGEGHISQNLSGFRLQLVRPMAK